MSYVFNPFTGTLDRVEIVTTKEILQNVLLEANQVNGYDQMCLLFDEDSILYNDEGAF